MKKQFFRVKQLADQTFSKGEKTEVPEDLSVTERRIDQLKQTCQNLSKKIQACIQGQGPIDSINREKRLKKIPEHQLGVACNDLTTCSLVEPQSPLWNLLKHFTVLQREVGQFVFEYEVAVDKEVLGKLNDLLETDIPNVMKNKKHLARLTLDMDATRARHAAALKSNNHAEKTDVIQEELDDAVQKVEQCRDSLAADMFALMARESEICLWFVKFAEAQACHHRKALQLLEDVLPVMKEEIKNHPLKPVFGEELETHLKCSKRQIAYPIETCICYLNDYGLKEEGLFRVAGSSSKLKRLKAAFDAGLVEKLDSTCYSYDVHTVAGALKSYLRELPNPLLNNSFYDDWMQVAKVNDVDARREEISKVLDRLPKTYLDNLRYFVKFLHKLTTYHESNKMSSQNLAIVIALNLIWSPQDPTDDMLGMNRLTGAHTLIVEMLISNADHFFPEEEEFGSHPRRSNEFGRDSELHVQPDVVPQTNGEADVVPPSPSLSSVSSTAYSDVYQNSPKPGSPKTARRPKKPAPLAPSTFHRHGQVTIDRDTGPGQPSHEPYHAEKPRNITAASRISLNAVSAFGGRPPPVPEKPPPVPDKPRQEVPGHKDAHMVHRRAPSYPGPVIVERPAAFLRSTPSSNVEEEPRAHPYLPGHRRQCSSPIQDFPQIEKTQVHLANIEKSQVTYVNVTPAHPNQDRSPAATEAAQNEDSPVEAEEKALEVTGDPQARASVPLDKPPERPPRPNCESQTSFLQRVRSFSQDADHRPRPLSSSHSPPTQQLHPPPPSALTPPQGPWQTHSLDRACRLSLPDSSEPPERPLKPERLRQATPSPSGVEDCANKEKESWQSVITPPPSASSTVAQQQMPMPMPRTNSPDDPQETTGAFRSSPVVPRRPPRPHPLAQPPQPPVPKPRSLHASSEDTYL